MKCVFCERELEPFSVDSFQPYDGGQLTLNFSFGSRYDQIESSPNSDDPMKRMLSSDLLVGYICDDCFDKKHHLFEGYHAIKTTEWQKVV
jgi:hypothetical protein